MVEITDQAKPSTPTTKIQADLSSESGTNGSTAIQHGDSGQSERAFSAMSTLLSGMLAISASQLLGSPLKLIDPKLYRGYMAWTKESCIILMTSITQWWAPTVIRVSGDESMKDQLFQMGDGTLKCNFPHRLVLMSNHQLYTDWLYLWWIAYTNKMHGWIYIILKESLKQLPFIGWGMQFYNFIFLSRKWEADKDQFKKHLGRLKNPNDPMWLLIFPEGTNLSAITREKSAAWSAKTGIPDMKNQLLPRTTGLQFCLKELRSSINWLYDATIAYEGVPKDLYGQDVFTLKSSFLEGRPPKSVNIFWRRFKISDIPLDNDQAFSRWLMNRWREKDYILEYFHKFGHFPAEDAMKALVAVRGKRTPQHARFISTSVQGRGWKEFMEIFEPFTSTATALSSVDVTEPLQLEKLLNSLLQPQNSIAQHRAKLEHSNGQRVTQQPHPSRIPNGSVTNPKPKHSRKNPRANLNRAITKPPVSNVSQANGMLPDGALNRRARIKGASLPGESPPRMPTPRAPTGKSEASQRASLAAANKAMTSAKSVKMQRLANGKVSQ